MAHPVADRLLLDACPPLCEDPLALLSTPLILGRRYHCTLFSDTGGTTGESRVRGLLEQDRVDR